MTSQQAKMAVPELSLTGTGQLSRVRRVYVSASFLVQRPEVRSTLPLQTLAN